MKIYLLIACLAAMLSGTANAAPNAAPFGFELGVATRADVQTQLAGKTRLDDAGINAVTHGKMLKTQGDGSGVDGLERVVFVLDTRDHLVGVELTFLKGFANEGTRKIADVLSHKYREVQRNLPSVGDGEARYVQGNSVIVLDSPHMSFVFTVAYMTNDFQRAMAKHDADQREHRAALTKGAL